MEASPKPPTSLGVRNANIYANETLTSFFRRLTFTPDGSLLFTPAGQYKTSHPSVGDNAKSSDDIINTVYIYTRAGFNKPPVAHLPGHKKPSIAVKCSPVYYHLRRSAAVTKNITIDTSSTEGTIPSLPEPAVPPKASTSNSFMEPPPLVPSASDSTLVSSSPKQSEAEQSAASIGPPPAFALPYRMVYAVATQDSVLLYDTQQTTPLCIISNLHFATFTDLTWFVLGSLFRFHFHF
jgi:chromatin assembly factor 1 subunit B